MGRKKVEKVSRIAGNKAIIYARVSTDEQVKHGKGLQAQEKLCRQYCEKNNFEVVSYLHDDGISGTKMPGEERPGIKEAIDRCAALDADVLVCYEQSRLARSPSVFETIINHALKHKYRIFTARDDQELTSEENDIPNDLNAIVISIERKLICRRLRTGRRERASENGHGTGPIPYGYKKIPVEQNGKIIWQIIVDEKAAEIVCTILKKRAQKQAYNAIAFDLNTMGIPTPNAGKTYKNGMPYSGRWTGGQVQGIERNRELYYTGRKTWDGIEAAEQWPVIMQMEEQLKEEQSEYKRY